MKYILLFAIIVAISSCTKSTVAPDAQDASYNARPKPLLQSYSQTYVGNGNELATLTFPLVNGVVKSTVLTLTHKLGGSGLFTSTLNQVSNDTMNITRYSQLTPDNVTLAYQAVEKVPFTVNPYSTWGILLNTSFTDTYKVTGNSWTVRTLISLFTPNCTNYYSLTDTVTATVTYTYTRAL